MRRTMRAADLNGADGNGGESAGYLCGAGGGCRQRGGMAVIMTDPSGIAAAGAGSGTGDNSNAVTMANLASGTIVNGQTPINYYSNFVSTLGSTVLGVQTENTAQNASVTQLQAQNNALSKRESE